MAKKQRGQNETSPITSTTTPINVSVTTTDKECQLSFVVYSINDVQEEEEWEQK